jgi:sec-independent protein translocase protein TatA
MVFGTSRLRNLGGDLGSAIKGFRNSMSKDESDSDESNPASREESDSDKPAT